jgi:hypothetical protein
VSDPREVLSMTQWLVTNFGSDLELAQLDMLYSTTTSPKGLLQCLHTSVYTQVVYSS